MTTLATLRAACRVLLANATTWPDATLNAYIKDAIRFYSAELPMIVTDTIKGNGDTSWTLPAGCLGVRWVRWGDYTMTQVDRTDPRWDAGDYVYTLIPLADDAADLQPPGTIAVPSAFASDTATNIVYAYATTHTIPSADADKISVPQPHWEALIAFVDFRCHWQLESTEAVDPDPETMVLAQLGDNSRRAWNRFKELIARYTFVAQGAKSAVVSWNPDRIY